MFFLSIFISSHFFKLICQALCPRLRMEKVFFLLPFFSLFQWYLLPCFKILPLFLSIYSLLMDNIYMSCVQEYQLLITFKLKYCFKSLPSFICMESLKMLTRVLLVNLLKILSNYSLQVSFSRFCHRC